MEKGCLFCGGQSRKSKAKRTIGSQFRVSLSHSRGIPISSTVGFDGLTIDELKSTDLELEWRELGWIARQYVVEQR